MENSHAPFGSWHTGEVTADYPPFLIQLKMGIEKGRPSEQSPKMKGIFYEAMQEKKLSDIPKPLILLGFSKSSVSPLAPNRVFITELCYGCSI